MNSFVDIFVGVAKIVVSVVGSAIASTQIPKPKETLKDFGFIITNVLLPCLFLSQMIEAISFQMVLDSYILFLSAGGAVGIGFVAARLLTRFVFPDKVRFSSVNGVVFSLTSAPRSSEGGRGTVTRQGALKGHRLLIRIPRGVSADEVMSSLLIPTKEDMASVGYRTCITIATMLQNTFVLPMSLIQSLTTKKGDGAASSFAWIDLQQVTAYIFFFNIVITIAFWMVGPLIVRGGARLTADRHKMCDIIARHQASMTKVTQATQTCGDAITDKRQEVALAPEPYTWRDAEDSIVVVTEGDASAATLLDDGANSGDAHSFDWEKVKGNIAPLINAPLLSMFLGMILGLIPFTKEFLLHGHGSVLFDVCKLIGDGTVPASLFLLGCNLSTDFSIIASKAVTFKHFSHGPLLPLEDEEDEEWEEDEEEPVVAEGGATAGAATNTNITASALKRLGNDSFTQVDDVALTRSFVKGQDPALLGLAGELAKVDEERRKAEEEVGGKKRKKKAKKQPAGDARSMPSLGTLFGLGGINKKFIVVLMATRLIIIPSILFAITYYLVDSKVVSSIADPCGNLLLLTLMVELFAPSAINTALLFNMEQFMIREYSKALLYQYSLAVVTLMGWLLLTVQIVQGEACTQHPNIVGPTQAPEDPADMEVVRHFAGMGIRSLIGAL